MSLARVIAEAKSVASAAEMVLVVSAAPWTEPAVRIR
jgi:hypothetical protein